MENKARKRLLLCVNRLMLEFSKNKGMPDHLLRSIETHYNKKCYRECIQEVRVFFGIRCDLRIGLVPSEKNPEYAWQEQLLSAMEQVGMPFDPTCFLTAAGIDHDDWPAKVIVNDPMPELNTKELENMQIPLLVKRWALKMPPETLIYIVSHELSHILLCATQNRYRKSEIATDILAMIMTGAKVIKKSRDINSFMPGHLNDEQFDIVYNQIIDNLSSRHF